MNTQNYTRTVFLKTFDSVFKRDRTPFPTSRKELSLDEVLQSYFLQADADQTYLPVVQLGFQTAELLGLRPAHGSSEPTQEEDDACLILPQAADRHHLDYRQGRRVIVIKHVRCIYVNILAIQRYCYFSA